MTTTKGSEDRKKIIFDAIEHLLLEEGPESLTYANISARCHLHTNTITYYFKNKEDMMLQFFQHVVERDSSMRPAFFHGVGEGMTPVESFCSFIDYVVECKHLRSETRRLINLYILPNLYTSDEVQSMIRQINEHSYKTEYQAIEFYRTQGIIEDERVDDAFADLLFAAYGYSLLLIFGVECPESDRALHNTKERLKKAFLKDGLYQETPFVKN